MPSPIETWQFATQQITKLLERLAYQVNSAARTPSPETVHDLRVAIRRLSQALAAFKTFLPGHSAKQVRRRLKRMMQLAGRARDCDIAIDLLLKSEDPDAPALRERVRANRKQAASALVAGLKRWVARKSSSKWRAALLPARPPQTCSYPIAEDEARHETPRMAKRFVKAGDRAAKPGASATEIHASRIVAKKFRYTLELFQPLYGAVAHTWLERLKDVQSLLGDINDCRVVRGLVAELGGSGAIESQLKKKQRKRTREFQKLWDERFSASATHDWIHQMQRLPRKPMGRSTATVHSHAVRA